MREALNLNACGIDTVEATRWSVSQSAAQPAAAARHLDLRSPADTLYT